MSTCLTLLTPHASCHIFCHIFWPLILNKVPSDQLLSLVSSPVSCHLTIMELMQLFQPLFLQNYPDSVLLLQCGHINSLELHIFCILFFPNVVIVKHQQLSFIEKVGIHSRFLFQQTFRLAIWFAHVKSRSVMDVVDEFGYVEVPRSLSRVQLLLGVEVLQPLMVCADVNLHSY